jgi:hypothetical protein
MILPLDMEVVCTKDEFTEEAVLVAVAETRLED